MQKVSGEDALVITNAPFASSALIDLFAGAGEQGTVLDENEVVFLQSVDDRICDVILRCIFFAKKSKTVRHFLQCKELLLFYGFGQNE